MTRLTYRVEELSATSGSIIFEWKKIHLSIPVYTIKYRP